MNKVFGMMQRMLVLLLAVSLCHVSLEAAGQVHRPSLRERSRPVGPIVRLAQLEEVPVEALPEVPPPELTPEPRPADSALPSGPRSYTIPFTGSPEAIRIEGGGDQVSLFVRDAPLQEVLSMLAQTQGLNIVASQDVTSRISITLDRVSLQETLQAITQVAGCTWYAERDIIYVTSLAGGAPLAPHLQGRAIEVFPLDFVAATDVDAAIKGGMLSPLGKSYVMLSNPANNRQTRETVIVEDLPAYLERIRHYIFQVDQPPQQVMIEVRVLQIELADESRHGVNFEQALRLSGHNLQLSAVGLAAPAAPQAFFAELNGGDLQALVECLQSTTDAKTLAAPKVLVINNQRARIQVGQHLGFRVVTTTETSSLESIEFLDVGVVLEVTPRITRDHRVLMRVKPEVSTGNVSAETGLPEEETTEVETDVLLHNGQGIVIGGLIQEVDSNIQGKLPLLGDIKYVGKLFQGRQTVKIRREIIFALVPHVLPYHPAHQCQLEDELQRAGTPLLYGPLDRFPRPEPQLPDTVHNPRTVEVPTLNYQVPSINIP